VRGPNIIPSPTIFFWKEILNSVGHFDTNLHMSADYDLFIRIGLKFRIEYIPKLLATYRLYPGTKTTSEFYKFGPDYLYIYDKLYSNGNIAKELQDVRRQAYSWAHLYTGQYYLYCNHQVKEARKHLLRAVIFRPQYLKTLWVLRNLALSLLGTRMADAAIRLWRRLRRNYPSQ